MSISKEAYGAGFGSEELDIMGDDDVGAGPQAIPSNHQLITELSELPPAQLLDGGSEDMELVSYNHLNGEVGWM